MKSITHTLIKRGLHELLAENESYFKENVIKTITFKLNESIKEVKNAVHTNLLMSPKFTKKNDDVIKFVNFVESFVPGKYSFKNGANINISDSDIEKLKKLFESLNPENREKMAETIFESAESLKEHINFSNKTKGII
jgi:hypothetical protein